MEALESLSGLRGTRLLDAFHITRLGFAAVDEVCRRIQREQPEHHGRHDNLSIVSGGCCAAAATTIRRHFDNYWLLRRCTAALCAPPRSETRLPRLVA